MGHSTGRIRLETGARDAGRGVGRARLAAAVLALVVGCVGCAGSQETEPLEVATGRNADISHDGLVRMSGSAFGGVWVKPDADASVYSKLLIGDVLMAYKRPPRGGSSMRGGNFPISDSARDRIEALLREELERHIEESASWSLATESGPDVMLIMPGLIDLVSNVPTDQPAGRNTTFTTSTGQATLVLELRDSQTHEIFARVADRQEIRSTAAGTNQLSWSNPVSNTSAVRRTFRRWADLFMARLDTAHRLASKGGSAAAADAAPALREAAEEAAAGSEEGSGADGTP